MVIYMQIVPRNGRDETHKNAHAPPARPATGDRFMQNDPNRSTLRGKILHILTFHAYKQPITDAILERAGHKIIQGNYEAFLRQDKLFQSGGFCGASSFARVWWWKTCHGLYGCKGVYERLHKDDVVVFPRLVLLC